IRIRLVPMRGGNEHFAWHSRQRVQHARIPHVARPDLFGDHPLPRRRRVSRHAAILLRRAPPENLKNPENLLQRMMRTVAGGRGGAPFHPSCTTSKSLAMSAENAGLRIELFQRASIVPVMYMSEPLSATIKP